MIITQTPLRIGLVGGGTDLPDYYRDLRGPGPQLRHRQVHLRHRQGTLRRRHLRQLLEEGDRLRRRGPRARAGARGHAHDRGHQRRGDHHAGRHPLGGLRSRLVLVGDRRSAPGAVRLPGAAAAGGGNGRAGLRDRDRAVRQARSASRTSTSPRSAGSGTSASGPGDGVVADEVALSPIERRALQEQIMLFYTGVTRSADTILAEQCDNVGSTLPQLHFLRDLAGVAVKHLASGDIDAVGAALRQGWEAKRKLASGVSNDAIDAAVKRALDVGATGAKVTGAGGGGFLLVVCPIERQRAVRQQPLPRCGSCRSSSTGSAPGWCSTWSATSGPDRPSRRLSRPLRSRAQAVRRLAWRRSLSCSPGTRGRTVTRLASAQAGRSWRR